MSRVGAGTSWILIHTTAVGACVLVFLRCYCVAIVLRCTAMYFDYRR